jgi:hypothetical protein
MMSEVPFVEKPNLAHAQLEADRTADEAEREEIRAELERIREGS